MAALSLERRNSTSLNAVLVCVVENVRGVLSIENTGQYRGLYHVLGGVISPVDGIGPADLELNSLVERVGEGEVKEVILALNPTMEGDTTNFYIQRRLAAFDVKITVLIVCIGIVREVFNRQKSLFRTQGYQTCYNPYGDIGHTQ